MFSTENTAVVHKQTHRLFTSSGNGESSQIVVEVLEIGGRFKEGGGRTGCTGVYPESRHQ